MRWQEAAPGLERAMRVQRPRADSEGRVYLRAKSRLDGVKKKGHPAFVVGGREALYAGEAMSSFYYNDTVSFSRVIAASRVERAVETQTFLDICEDEGLWVRLYDEWTVGERSNCFIGAESKSLRGAYLNYHKQKEASE